MLNWSKRVRRLQREQSGLDSPVTLKEAINATDPAGRNKRRNRRRRKSRSAQRIERKGREGRQTSREDDRRVERASWRGARALCIIIEPPVRIKGSWRALLLLRSATASSSVS